MTPLSVGPRFLSCHFRAMFLGLKIKNLQVYTLLLSGFSWPVFPHSLAHHPAQTVTGTPLSLVSVSPQGLELFRRKTRVTVSPPETWVLNLEAGDEAQHSPEQHTGSWSGGAGREEAPQWSVFILDSPRPCSAW